MLASSNYVTTFPADSQLAERVIFPAGPNETRGMEDARFVRFTDDDGRGKYYATYTAYDGFEILPQLIETDDFVRVHDLHAERRGRAEQRHGAVPAPDRRQVRDAVAQGSREPAPRDVDDVHFWNDVTELYRPQHPWELLQIGNCGSPIETEAGWLVLTHGVGPMRRYAIGALLLDLDDPRRVHRPSAENRCIEPDENEREGYVPNVVYTCGAIVHGDQLVLPYGFSDAGIAVAQVELSDLLEALLASGRQDLSRTASLER